MKKHSKETYSYTYELVSVKLKIMFQTSLCWLISLLYFIMINKTKSSETTDMWTLLHLAMLLVTFILMKKLTFSNHAWHSFSHFYY